MYERQLLSNNNIDPGVVDQYDILVLPENFGRPSDGKQLQDTGDSADFCKALREAGARCANSYDLNLNAQVLERRGDDVWFGTVWVLSTIGLNVVSSIITQIIWQRLKSRNRATSEQINDDVRVPQASLEIRIVRGNCTTVIRYSGDAETLARIMEAIGASETNGEGTVSN